MSLRRDLTRHQLRQVGWRGRKARAPRDQRRNERAAEDIATVHAVLRQRRALRESER